MGAEFKIKNYFKPEIETSILFGGLQDRTLKDDLSDVTDLYVNSIYSVNFCFCPKVCLGNNGEGESYLTLRPKYNFSKIQASGSHFIINIFLTLIKVFSPKSFINLKTNGL